MMFLYKLYYMINEVILEDVVKMFRRCIEIILFIKYVCNLLNRFLCRRYIDLISFSEFYGCF